MRYARCVDLLDDLHAGLAQTNPASCNVSTNATYLRL
jgi:hypothetical protein